MAFSHSYLLPLLLLQLISPSLHLGSIVPHVTVVFLSYVPYTYRHQRHIVLHFLHYTAQTTPGWLPSAVWSAVTACLPHSTYLYHSDHRFLDNTTPHFHSLILAAVYRIRLPLRTLVVPLRTRTHAPAPPPCVAYTRAHHLLPASCAPRLRIFLRAALPLLPHAAYARVSLAVPHFRACAHIPCVTRLPRSAYLFYFRTRFTAPPRDACSLPRITLPLSA